MEYLFYRFYGVNLRKLKGLFFFHFPLYLGGSPLPSYDGEPNYWRAVPSTTVIKGAWKLIKYYEYDNYELFNLNRDISEEYNLAGLYPAIENMLLTEIEHWNREVNAPIPYLPTDKFIAKKGN